MSVHIMSLCFRAKFGSPYLKAIAVALADHASDDGSRIWPSVATLADKTEIAVRTVQYKLRDLETLGLIVCVDEGGKGAKDTREYKFDMAVLKGLAEGELAIVENNDEGAPDAPIEGAGRAPFKLVRVHPTTIRVQPTTDKGAPGAPEPSINHQEPSARERAKTSNDDLKKEEKPQRARPAITISRSDASWNTWIGHLSAVYPNMLEAAEYHGEIIADARWPDKATIVPKVRPLPRKVSGEVA